MKPQTILSLFDGKSGGQIALRGMGVPIARYYASEIDKPAITVCLANHPDTIQLGDVTRWREWDIDWTSIDLVLAGSPCQGFSFAGKMLAFEDPRSALFFVFVEIWRHVQAHNPYAYFLLENVKMRTVDEVVISRYMGIAPIEIDSALLSAQTRKRLYWTNIASEPYGLFGDMRCAIEQPKDIGIFLPDVLQDDAPQDYTIKSQTRLDFILNEWRINKRYTQIDGAKALPLMARTYGSWSGDYISTADGYRQLTPTECERLQTVPDGYTAHVSDTHRYRMLGNGWTVDVIKYILSHLYSITK